jgi:quercetin dioxygenase-like cupin family protein
VSARPCETPALSAFEDLSDIGPQQLFAGYLARAVHGDGLTFAVVEIGPGAALPEHHHQNEQLGMVLRGTMTLRVADGAVALDVFAPPREDWKALDAEEPRPTLWP